MEITEIESAIIERLKSKITDLLVEGYPDDPESYKLLHPKGALLVRYSNSTYSDPDSMGVVSQDRKMEFEVNVVARNLKNRKDKEARAGAYEYLEAVRYALAGFKISGINKMFPTRDGFVKEEGGIWVYAMAFATSTVAVEIEEEELLPLLTRVTFVNDITGDTEVVE